MVDTAQLPIFIPALAKDRSIHEGLVALIPLRHTTRGVDTKEAVLNVLHSRMPNSSLSSQLAHLL